MHENDKELDLGEAYQAYFNTIRRYVVSRLRCDTATAEDVSSDVFFLLQTKWDELSSHEPRLILTWLYRTANFVLLSYQRKLARRATAQEWERALREYTADTDGIHFPIGFVMLSFESAVGVRESGACSPCKRER